MVQVSRPAMELTVSPRKTEIAKVDRRLRFGNLVPCLHRNKMLHFRHASTSCRTSLIMPRFLEVVVLNMANTPVLSVITRIQ